MTDAQNERTSTGGRRRNRRGQPGKPGQAPVTRHEPTRDKSPDAPVIEAPGDTLTATEPGAAELVRPANIEPPVERMEVYCVHHMVLVPEHEPFNPRANMTTIRHLAVDRFGEATLFCDCLHNGPHEWPSSLQQLETAIELDQFLTDSTREA